MHFLNAQSNRNEKNEDGTEKKYIPSSYISTTSNEGRGRYMSSQIYLEVPFPM